MAVQNKAEGSAISTTQSLVKFLALILIAGAGISSRLFSVIRFESIIHEFDPWFNFRASKYLVNNGFYKFLNWFDDRTWYPLGRVTGGTLYPGLMVTSSLIYKVLRLLSLPVDIRNICVLLAPVFSGLTAYATYLFTSEMKDESAGLLAAAFVAIAPGYISRSVAGSYDNEAIAIFLLMFTFYLWIKAVKVGSIYYGTLTALFYFYMVAAWGGYVFITNVIPLHALCLVLMGRYSNRLYIAYSTWYAIGTLSSMQIPFVGFLPIRSSEHMAALGMFGLIQLVGFAMYLRSRLTAKRFRQLLFLTVLVIVAIGILGVTALSLAGVIAPWGGRFYSLWDTNYAKIHIPIIASVSEHQPTAWPAFFFDNGFLIWAFPAGIFYLFQNLRDEHLFVIIYAVLNSYFAGVMVRLMLTLTPVICVLAGIILSGIFDLYLKKGTAKNINNNDSTHGSGKATGAAAATSDTKIQRTLPKVAVMTLFSCLLVQYVRHCTWATSSAYSSPSVVLTSMTPDGHPHIIDDFREAYSWLRKNTPYDARVMSWWDYGYQIGGMADRTTLVDNNTWNNTHIATVGKAMSSSEDVSYPILRQHDVDYVLVIFGGAIGYSGDDINKFLWMVRIAEGLWPDEVKERDFFTDRGEYRVDEQATKTMRESLMYKMCYYRFNELYGGGPAPDRVRNQNIPPRPITLNTLEEVFTSENWIVRLYKVKDLDNFGRTHVRARQFDEGTKRTKRKSGASSSNRLMKLRID